jgi:hypothetical protein
MSGLRFFPTRYKMSCTFREGAGPIIRLDLLIGFELDLSFAVCCPAKETALAGGRVNNSGITRSRA